MSRHVTSCHVMSRHVTSWHVMSRRKSRDGHTTNASLSTDFFHTQLIRVEHDRVRWFSRRLPIPYRISGIWFILCKEAFKCELSLYIHSSKNNLIHGIQNNVVCCFQIRTSANLLATKRITKSYMRACVPLQCNVLFDLLFIIFSPSRTVSGGFGMTS